MHDYAEVIDADEVDQAIQKFGRENILGLRYGDFMVPFGKRLKRLRFPTQMSPQNQEMAEEAPNKKALTTIIGYAVSYLVLRARFYFTDLPQKQQVDRNVLRTF